MEFKIKKRDLVKSLERTLSIVERRSTMPALNHALLEIKDEQLQVSATDLEIFVSSQVPCKSLTEGRVSVPARSLYDIAKELADDNDIHVKAGAGAKVEIQSGRTRFKLNGLSADSFPHFKASPKGQLSHANLPTQEFAQLIARTDYAVATEETRYFLTGVYLETVNENGKSMLRAVATDGHRLAMRNYETKSIELKKGLIIPKKACQELRKILESSKDDTFELTCDENLLRAKVGEEQLWVRPIDGEYPNYRPVVPQSLKCQLTVDRSDFVLALKKMSLLVSDRSKVVTFEFLEKQFVVSTNNPDLGEAQDEVSFKGKSPEIKTGFNVRFFLEALSHFEGDEIVFEVGEKLQPVLMRNPEDPSYLTVIMPMRI